jgi:hypothetical protein
VLPRWKQYAGYDHEGLKRGLTVAWPTAETWLLQQDHEQRLRTHRSPHSERVKTLLRHAITIISAFEDGVIRTCERFAMDDTVGIIRLDVGELLGYVCR